MSSKGWIKSYRSMQYSPVWRHHHASIVFQWLLWNVRTTPTRQPAGNKMVELERGQTFTQYEVIAARNFLSVDQVRRAFAVLRNLEMIAWEGGRHGILVTICNYRRYQDSPSSEAMERGDENEECAHRKTRRETTRENFPGAAGNKDGISEEKENSCAGAVGGRRREAGSAAAAMPAVNPANHIRNKKRKNTHIPPYPPFEKGGDIADSSALSGSGDERERMVLDMWRDAWREAGRPLTDGLVGSRTAAGARRLARQLDAVGSGVDRLRAGMADLVRRIIDNPQHYEKCDLLTLANNPDKYGDRHGIVTTLPKRPKIIWEYVCGICNESMVTSPWPAEAEPPRPQPCVKAGYGCQGMMRVSKLTETEA